MEADVIPSQLSNLKSINIGSLTDFVTRPPKKSIAGIIFLLIVVCVIRRHERETEHRIRQTSNEMLGQLDASRTARFGHELDISRSVSSVTQEQDDISSFANKGQAVAA
jgi:hypothetical protein